MRFGLQDELDELNYVRENFEIGSTDADIVTKVHDTIIYVCDTHSDAVDNFLVYMKDYKTQYREPQSVFIKDLKIWQGFTRIMFKTRKQVLSGGLRGYDKISTIIINRGGI